MAAAAEPASELNAELECPICQDRYTDPIDLTCGHNFCRNCVLSAFHAACSNPDKTTHREHVDCPVCRKRLFTSEERIKSMPVNLKLRNIILALQDTPIAKPTVCETHNKPHQIYCHDCKDVKCLTCYIKNCSRSGHNTEEIDDMAVHMRSVLTTKKDRVKELLSAARTRVEAGQGCTELLDDDLPFLLEQVEKHRDKLLEQHTTECKRFISKLEELEKSSNTSIVVERSNIEKMSIQGQTHFKLESVSSVCDSVYSDLRAVAQKLRKILQENDMATEGKKKKNEGASADIVANVETMDSLLQTLVESITTSLRPSLTLRPSLPQLEVITRFDLSHLVNDVSNIRGKLTICTSNGIISVTGTETTISREYFDDINVIDTCVASYDKQLVLTEDDVHIHRCSDLDDNQPVFTLRPNRNNGGNDSFSSACSMRKDGQWIYLLADPYGLEYWDVQARSWNKELCIQNFTDHFGASPPSYRFCTEDRTCIIFFTLRDEGLVLAYDDDIGEVMWRDTTTCRKPAGIAADWTKVYVCESHESNPCVVVFDYAGDVITKIGVHDIGTPWSIAVSPYTLVVAAKSRVLGANTVLFLKIWDVELSELQP